MNRAHVYRAEVAQLNFCQWPPDASLMIDGLYDGHIASNKLRMTYCKTAPSLFSVSNSGQNLSGQHLQVTSTVFPVMLPPALFLEEAKAFLRFFFGEL